MLVLCICTCLSELAHASALEQCLRWTNHGSAMEPSVYSWSSSKRWYYQSCGTYHLSKCNRANAGTNTTSVITARCHIPMSQSPWQSDMGAGALGGSQASTIGMVEYSNNKVTRKHSYIKKHCSGYFLQSLTCMHHLLHVLNAPCSILENSKSILRSWRC